MNGMLTHRFSGWSSEDLAFSHSFHHEFAPGGRPVRVLLDPGESRNDDQAGTPQDLGFFCYTYTDPDGTPHEIPIDYGSRVSVVAHNRITRVLTGTLRIYKATRRGCSTSSSGTRSGNGACRHHSFPALAKRPRSQARSLWLSTSPTPAGVMHLHTVHMHEGLREVSPVGRGRTGATARADARARARQTRNRRVHRRHLRTAATPDRPSHGWIRAARHARTRALSVKPVLFRQRATSVSTSRATGPASAAWSEPRFARRAFGLSSMASRLLQRPW